ncbi:MAG: hypothetical protein JWN46_507 [Acidimicrobiales bacterium]|nr:hypothetical protein [Acidimicrobiales bacterium]
MPGADDTTTLPPGTPPPHPTPSGPRHAAPRSSPGADDAAAGGWPRWATLAVGLLVVLPVLVLIVALARRTWYPTGDQAQAELRMRSLPRHPPLLGAAGRIVDHQGRQGTHPGPLMFWVTWPVYALLGRSAWAFEAATALVNAVWLGMAVWLARRRGGPVLAWWAGIVLLLLVGGYGLSALSQPWNPWVALLPFSVLLFATWCLLEGDRWLLPLAVFAGSYSLQGHAGYAVLVPMLLLVGTGAVLWRSWRDRHGLERAGSSGRTDSRSPPRSGRRAWVPIVVAVLVGLAAWSGPIVDAVRHHPSNVDKLVANFGSPDKPPIGLRHAAEAVVQSLDPTGVWLTGGDAVQGSRLLGGLLLAAWAAVSVVAWRRGARSLTRLNALLALTLLAGWYSVSRVFGDFYLYVFRWICALTAAVVFSLGWGLATLLPRRSLPPGTARRLGGAALVVLVGLAALTSVRLARAPLPYDYTGRLERTLAPATAARLDRGRRYLITWDDPAYLGGLGFGLLLDLERRGFQVGAEARFSTAVEPRRVRCPGSYDAVLTVVTSESHLAVWRAKPGVRQIAAADIRTPAAKAAYARDFTALQAELARRGTRYDASQLDGVINFLLLDSKQPKVISRLASRLVLAGVPSAVFLTDPAPNPGPVPRDALDEPCWKP